MKSECYGSQEDTAFLENAFPNASFFLTLVSVEAPTWFRVYPPTCANNNCNNCGSDLCEICASLTLFSKLLVRDAQRCLLHGALPKQKGEFPSSPPSPDIAQCPTAFLNNSAWSLLESFARAVHLQPLSGRVHSTCVSRQCLPRFCLLPIPAAPNSFGAMQ